MYEDQGVEGHEGGGSQRVDAAGGGEAGDQSGCRDDRGGRGGLEDIDGDANR
jgi:hypothetical protein